MEVVIIYKTDAQFYFALKADNGAVILVSQGCTSKEGIREDIKSLKVWSKDDSSFDRMTSKSNKFYFDLMEPGGGLVVGQSKLYTSPKRMEEVIEAVKKNASKAKITDLSKEGRKRVHRDKF